MNIDDTAVVITVFGRSAVLGRWCMPRLKYLKKGKRKKRVSCAVTTIVA
jgi:hypothetical protein